MEERALESAFLPELNADVEEQNPPQAEEGQLEETSPEEGDGGQGEETLEAEEVAETVPKSQYDELRKTFTQKSMELAALKKGVPQQEQVTAPENQNPAYIPQQAPNTLTGVVNQLVQQQLSAVLAPIQQQQQDLYYQSETMALASRHKDFDEVAPLFVQVLEETPEFFDMPNGLERAYQVARADHLSRVMEARTKAAVDTSKKMQAQKVAITDPAQLTKQQGASQTSAEDEIRKGILSAGGGRSIWD